MKKLFTFLIFFILIINTSFGQDYPTPVEGNYVINNFHFEDGESLPKLNIHYIIIGKPTRDKDGMVNNAVLIMHGTTGSGKGFLVPTFAGYLFGPGDLLDANKYFIILPDAIGTGESSKPSDGMHMKFPKYDYNDMVLANYKLLTEHLKVNHLRLVMGTSMGAMESWVWGYTYPDFMDAIMPLACLPVQMGGRNWMQRALIVKLIEMDPAWKNGEYKKEPKVGLSGAIGQMMFMVSSPLQWRKEAPTREEADEKLDKLLKRYLSILDANDMIYQFMASRNYNPAPYLTKIKAPVFAINSADDQVNPPELGIMKKEIKKVKNGRYILLPITNKTRGHGTHSLPAIWGKYLDELLTISGEK